MNNKNRSMCALKKGSAVYLRAPRPRDREEIIKLHRASVDFYKGLASAITIPRYLKVCGRWRDHERWAILAEEWRKGGG